jgi:hypothetical protein
MISKLINIRSKDGTIEPKKEDIELAGFVIGSILGASLSTFPYYIIQKMKQQTTSKFLNKDEKQLHFNKDSFLSQNFYLMSGAFAGILANFTARYGAHIGFNTFMTRFLQSRFSAPADTPGGDVLVKMLINNAMKTYNAFASTFLRPTLPSNKPKDDSSSQQSLQPLKDMLFRMVSSQLMDGQLPLDNPIVKRAMEWYLGTSNEAHEEEESNEKSGYVNQAWKKIKQVRSKYDDTKKKIETAAAPTIERFYPSENRSWHGWSTSGAQYFASKWAKEYDNETKNKSGNATSRENELSHHLVQDMLRKVRDVLDGVGVVGDGIRSRL